MSWSPARIAVAVAFTAAALPLQIVACASQENDDLQAVPPEESKIPEPPQADTGPGDAAVADACTTDDCEHFPVECTADVLCPTGPFDPVDPARGLPWLTTPRVLVGRSPSDVWLAGSLGAYSQFDGSSWKPLDADTQTSARAFWLTPSGEVAVTDHTALFVRGSKFVTTSEASPGGFATASLKNQPSDFGSKATAGFAPAGSTTLWLATDTTLWRLVETSEGEIEVQPGIPPARCSMLCQQMRSIHGTSAKTLFAVGELGAAIRIEGADSDSPKLSAFNSGTTMGLWGVFAASESDVWAVGGRGTVRRWTGDGFTWRGVDGIPTIENLNAVWGTSSNDIWVAGDGAVVLHYDGATWSRVKIAGLGSRRPPMTAIWGTANGKVYVAGQGVVLSLGGTP